MAKAKIFRTNSGGKIHIPDSLRELIGQYVVREEEVFAYDTVANGGAYRGTLEIECANTGKVDAERRQVFETKNGVEFVCAYRAGTAYYFDRASLQPYEGIVGIGNTKFPITKRGTVVVPANMIAVRQMETERQVAPNRLWIKTAKSGEEMEFPEKWKLIPVGGQEEVLIGDGQDAERRFVRNKGGEIEISPPRNRS